MNKSSGKYNISGGSKKDPHSVEILTSVKLLKDYTGQEASNYSSTGSLLFVRTPNEPGILMRTTKSIDKSYEKHSGGASKSLEVRKSEKNFFFNSSCSSLEMNQVSHPEQALKAEQKRLELKGVEQKEAEEKGLEQKGFEQKEAEEKGLEQNGALKYVKEVSTSVEARAKVQKIFCNLAKSLVKEKGPKEILETELVQLSSLLSLCSSLAISNKINEEFELSVDNKTMYRSILLSDSLDDEQSEQFDLFDVSTVLTELEAILGEQKLAAYKQRIETELITAMKIPKN